MREEVWWQKGKVSSVGQAYDSLPAATITPYFPLMEEDKARPYLLPLYVPDPNIEFDSPSQRIDCPCPFSYPLSIPSSPRHLSCTR